MRREEKISVAMAAYNGMQYIKEQINSILIQLQDDDELVISCDPSSDGTWEFVYDLSKNNNKIKPIKGGGKGVIKNFENALLCCKNEYIFLCDQDDIWMPNKVEAVLDEFRNKDISLVLHDASIVNSELEIIEESFFIWRNSKQGFCRNFIKNSYIGCCMAFKKSVLDFALPFPENIPMHDQWIGMLNQSISSESFLKEKLILYRRHGENLSSDKPAGIKQMILWRISLLSNFRKRKNKWRKKK